VNFFTTVLGPKRLELFRQLVPKATTFGMLVNPNNPDTEAERRDVQASAQAIGQQLKSKSGLPHDTSDSVSR